MTFLPKLECAALVFGVQSLALACLLGLALAAQGVTLPVIERNGIQYVEAPALERESGIAIKRIESSGEFVACAADRCARVKGAQAEGKQVIVPVDALCSALAVEAQFDETRRAVTLKLLSTENKNSTPAVGSLAPNFRLTKLDGTTVALADFRGKRVLINSWASW